ncbi:polysaccharide deacetylase family protein [uncultured Bacteroides sp.]|uniref:polysaccharide deacetylase family protein n=1 Tax=uncultured Bacteroides sp. TaxID=162156 RepID=UPI00259783AC|nr:polysaccharide deacetylase family protein [uncultured Bacteroides sp.]
MSNILFRIKRGILFRIIRFLCISKINTSSKVVYITFDDGPNPTITPQVLEILDRFNAKATFFNTGENMGKYPELVQLTEKKGHTIALHSYSHPNCLIIDENSYIKDIEKGYDVYNTNILRPPYGALTLSAYRKLKNKYKIVIWNKGSLDHIPNLNNLDNHIKNMVKNTSSGDILLMHNMEESKDITLYILPRYLEEIYKRGYKVLNL